MVHHNSRCNTVQCSLLKTLDSISSGVENGIYFNLVFALPSFCANFCIYKTRIKRFYC